jgi:hypothetical protein
MSVVWAIVATPGASLLAGMICLFMLWRAGGLRDAGGALKRLTFASAVTLGASFYTTLVRVTGEFFIGRSLSETIKTGFGDGRIAWLLVALAVDTSTRVIALFDGNTE